MVLRGCLFLFRVGCFTSAVIAWVLLVLALTTAKTHATEFSLIKCSTYRDMLISNYAVYFIFVSFQTTMFMDQAWLNTFRADRALERNLFLTRIVIGALLVAFEIFILIVTGASVATSNSEDIRNFRVLSCYQEELLWGNFIFICVTIILNLMLLYVIMQQHLDSLATQPLPNLGIIPDRDQAIIEVNGHEILNGLSDPEINSIAIIQISRKDVDCAICMCDSGSPKASELENTLIDVRKLRCGHQFHPACIDAWLKIKNVCPKCRSLVVT
jgi:hypothetical protein